MPRNRRPKTAQTTAPTPDDLDPADFAGVVMIANAPYELFVPRSVRHPDTGQPVPGLIAGGCIYLARRWGQPVLALAAANAASVLWQTRIRPDRPPPWLLATPVTVRSVSFNLVVPRLGGPGRYAVSLYRREIRVWATGPHALARTAIEAVDRAWSETKDWFGGAGDDDDATAEAA